MITFNKAFSNSLHCCLIAIKDANNFFNTTNIDIVLFKTHLQRFETVQHLPDNAVNHLHLTINLDETSPEQIDCDLFAGLTGNFFAEFKSAVDTDTFNSLVVAPQLGATISVPASTLIDYLNLALSIKYMAQYASAMQTICQAGTPISYSQLLKIQELKELMTTVIELDFTDIGQFDDFLVDLHVL